MNLLFFDGPVEALRRIETPRPKSLWGPNTLIEAYIYYNTNEHIEGGRSGLPFDPISEDHLMVVEIAAELK